MGDCRYEDPLAAEGITVYSVLEIFEQMTFIQNGIVKASFLCQLQKTFHSEPAPDVLTPSKGISRFWFLKGFRF